MTNPNYDSLIQEAERIKLLLREQPQMKDEGRNLRPQVGLLKPNARRHAIALLQRLRELDDILIQAKATAGKLVKELALDKHRQNVIGQEQANDSKNS